MTRWLIEVITWLGYPGVAFLMFVENIFPPLPSELILPFAGFAVAAGDLQLGWVIVASVVGTVVGTLPLYYVGRAIGEVRLRRWIARYGHWLAVCEEDMDKAKAWFERYGGWAVLLCRMVPGLRSWISVPAGLTHFNIWKYLLLTTIGSALWCTVLVVAGRVLGSQYERIQRILDPVTYVILAMLVVLLIVRLVHVRQVRQAAQAEPC